MPLRKKEKNEKNKSEKIPENSVSLHIVESALSSPDGTTWGDLRDELPEIVRADAMAKAKIACEPIYKRRTTLNGNCPPKTGPGPLALFCLLTPSLALPCYTGDMQEATLMKTLYYTAQLKRNHLQTHDTFHAPTCLVCA